MDKLLDRLHAQACRLPIPTDFLRGPSAELADLPSNVVLHHAHYGGNRQPRTAGRYPRRAGPHLIRRFSLNVSIRAAAEMLIEGRQLGIPEGHGLLVFPFQAHNITRFEPVESFSWMFTTFDMPESGHIEPLRNCVVAFEPLDWEIIGHATDVMAAWHRGERARAAELPHWLGLLLERAVTRARQTGRAETPVQLDVGDDVAHRACRWIYDHLAEDLRTETIARQMSLSESHMRRVFREEIGMSLGEFVRNARIHRAASLLHSTSLPVGALAQRCGYESPFTFSRAFKNAVGVSPLHFRKRART